MTDEGLGIFGTDEDDDRDAGSTRASGRERSGVRRALAVLAGILGVIVIAAVGLGFFYVNTVNEALDTMQRDQSMPAPYPGRPTTMPPKKEGPPAVNVLLLGSDSRGADRGRSDVMILAHIPGNRQKVHLISIPRDSWVPVPGHGDAKINAAYAYGGNALAVRTVEELVQVPIEHTVVIDFDGFIRLTDVVGGVKVNNRYASSAPGCSFPVGEVTLSGNCALEYVRERKELPGGDLSRAERQRDVLGGIVDKLMDPAIIANPAKFREVAGRIAPLIRTDGGFTSDAIRKLGLAMKLDGRADIELGQVPVSGTGQSDDGQSIVILDQNRMIDLRNALRDDTLDDYWSNR